jgi:hypothetical protein
MIEVLTQNSVDCFLITSNQIHGLKYGEKLSLPVNVKNHFKKLSGTQILSGIKT